MHEHLNTPEGAIYGFAMVPPKSLPKQPPRSIETSVEGLWISSAYTGFGGVTGAMGGASPPPAPQRARTLAIS